MFSKIKARTIQLHNFLFAHKKQVALFVFLVVFGLGVTTVFGGRPAMADATAGAFDPNIFVKAITTMMLSGAALMIRLAVFCLSFIIEIAGYNGYLNSTAVQVGWVMVRDITNMFFVVVLLLVAFGTILGLEQYEWKKMLVKFFFAAILVNFSRIICGLMIDISQVVMITFVNGIAATAGGNLIQAFSLDKIYSLNPESGPQGLTSNSEIFGAAVGALGFAALTLGIMAVFVFMLLARLLVLWILIVLSPFAFVLSVIPQTEKYASQWWSEFGNHVLVGPIVVFFLWLSFAVVGSGQINSEISSKENNSAPQENMPGAKVNGAAATVGISAVMSFDKIANFAIAIGILLVGAKTAQSLGTVGGSAMSKTTDFAKKAVMIGSGAAAGIWAAGKAKEGIKAGAKLAYQVSPVSDWVERTQNNLKRQVESWKIYRAEGPTLKTEDYFDAKSGEMRKKFVNKKDKDGKDIEGEYEFEDDKRSWFQKQRYNSRAKLIGSRKELKKTEDQAKLRDELIDKRITAIPKGLFLRKMPDGFDRVEQGMLAAEKERSAAKTSEFQEYGRQAVLGSARFKDGEFLYEKDKETGELVRDANGNLKPKGGTIAQQVVGHNERAERNKERTKAMMSGVLEEYRKSGTGKSVVAAKVEAKFKAELSEKQAHLSEGTEKLHFMQRAGDLLTKQAKIAAEEKEEHAKVERLETKAAAEFSGTGPGKHMLEEQAAAEIDADTYKTQMANNLTSAKHKHDEEAIKAELAAQEILQGVSGKHSDSAAQKLADRKAKQDEIGRLQSTKQKLQSNIDNAATPEDLAKAKKAMASFESTGSIKRIEDQVEALDADIINLDKGDEELQKKKAAAKEAARKKRESSISWANSAAHAKETEAKNAFSRDHNYLLGEVEQEEIFKPRGITVPNEALSEAREYYRKRFTDMDYDTYTASLGTNIAAMMEKRKDAATKQNLQSNIDKAANPEDLAKAKKEMDNFLSAGPAGRGDGPSAADKSVMAAMLDHGVTKSWLDDGVWRVMAADLKEEVGGALGWKGKEFNEEKINDLMTLMTTGGDLEFAKMHKDVAKVMDFAVHEMGMGVAQFYDKLENQSFNPSELATIGSQFGADSKQFKTVTDSSKMKQYIKTQDDNQAQIQFVTNLRDEMAGGSHTENGGHAVNIKSSNGKQRHVFVSGSIAQDNVLGEVNKDTVANRAKKQSHSYLNLDEGSGYATRTRAKAYRISRGDVNNHLSHSGTNQRYLNHIAGLAPTENVEDYFTQNDGLLITGTKASGADSGRHAWAQNFSDDGIELKERYDAIRSTYAAGGKWNGINNVEDALHQQTTNDWFNELVKDQLFTNPQDVLMSLAKKSQIDPQDAYLTGKMNISVMVKGKKQKINNISKLIEFYNSGAFSANGNPPQKKMAQFKPASPKGRANALANSDEG